MSIRNGSRIDSTQGETSPAIDPTLAEVRRQLQASPYAAIKQLTTEFHEGVLIVRGDVPTFFTRQVALSIVSKVDGVELLVDQIVVAWR